jgi:MoaA/NifB/PqqE/SkfB family radical SAM enzyme
MSAERFRDVVNLYLLTECDMGCAFCYASKNLGKMASERAISLITSLARLGADRLNITGGEVMMYSEALRVVQHAHDCGIQVCLFTSGSLYTLDKIKSFSPLLSWLALSLDGDSSVNVKVGRSPRHFDSVLRAIQQTREVSSSVRIRVATVVTRLNVHHLDDLARILADARYRPDSWRLKQMVPTRRAQVNSSELSLGAEEFQKAALAVKSKYGDLLHIDMKPAAEKIADTMCIHPDGDATVTVMDDGEFKIHSLGNVFADLCAVLEKWRKFRDLYNATAYREQWDLIVGTESRR